MRLSLSCRVPERNPCAQFVDFDEDSGIVTLRMRGACSGCPSSSATLKGGIENMLMHYVPEVCPIADSAHPAQRPPATGFTI